MITLSKSSDFITHEVIFNEVGVKPVEHPAEEPDFIMYMHKKINETIDERGKDVVVDWDFLDGFDTDGKLYYDTNGLDMLDKELWKRKEYELKDFNNSALNYFPVTSAAVIRDKNSNKQVTVMTDHSHTFSAGMRNHSNIEFI